MARICDECLTAAYDLVVADCDDPFGIDRVTLEIVAMDSGAALPDHACMVDDPDAPGVTSCGCGCAAARGQMAQGLGEIAAFVQLHGTYS